MPFLELLWSILIIFVLVAYLMVMFAIIADLFRDDSTSGVAKAVWILALIFLPVLTSLVYLIARGDGMARRQARDVRAAREAQEEWVRDVAGASPAKQIEDARRLLDSGAITAAEFDQLKAKALA
jgi:hypothetical protein